MRHFWKRTLYALVVAAVSLYQGNLIGRFVCTGGVGEDPRSEASVCSEYLQAHGVPADRIILEERSGNTYENLVNAKEVLQAHNLKSVLIVTHGFHSRRALLQARDLGIQAQAAPVTIKPINERYLILREVAATTYYQLGGRARVGLFRWSVIDR